MSSGGKNDTVFLDENVFIAAQCPSAVILLHSKHSGQLLVTLVSNGAYDVIDQVDLRVVQKCLRLLVMVISHFGK